MKNLTLLTLAILFNLSPSFASEEGGMVTSGGGEFITDEHNPWFFRKKSEPDKKISWCIDHGGKENFSLDLPTAKVEIERALNTFDKLITDASFETYGVEYKPYPNNQGYSYGPVSALGNLFGAEPKDYYKLNTHFVFETSCNSDTDLTFILGNIKSPRVQRMIMQYGEFKLRKVAGVAMRESYEFNENLSETKGFIYIAADLGKMSYSGLRHDNTSDGEFWGKSFIIHVDWDEWDAFHPLLDKEKLTEKSFYPVLIHELGHVYGFRHTDSTKGFNFSSFSTMMTPTGEFDSYKIDIMDEDFPAQTIRYGGVPKKALKNGLGYFGRGFNKEYLRFNRKDGHYRLAIKLDRGAWGRDKILSERFEKAGYAEYFSNAHSILIQQHFDGFKFSFLKLDQPVYPCILDLDVYHPTYGSDSSSEGFRFKNMKECRDYYRKNPPKNGFKFTEIPFAIGSKSNRSLEEAESLSGVTQKVFSHGTMDWGRVKIGKVLTIQVINFTQKTYNFTANVILNGKEVPHFFELQMGLNGGRDIRFKFINLKTHEHKTFGAKGITFFDNEYPESPLPPMFDEY